MSKRQKANISLHPLNKKVGRSYGPLVIDPVLGDKVTKKVLNSRKSNNPKRYQTKN
jgi:hypothetical protein